MSENIFETLKGRKENLRHLIEKASSFGWIDEARKKDLLHKIDSDTLTIGVIGQMKCGKSTFLNSFVFDNTVLPSATTPMTAALSVITYGEREKIVAEFYTADEWAEQQMQATRNIEDAQGNAAEESKIKAAKELVGKSHKLGSQLPQLLGKTQEDDFDNLIEYVGADGKYISITKSVTIYYPKDYLKGVEIVDTPGFNDPIVSREERTKEFLKRADVVLMMLYAGRPFDATDRDIIFKNVRQCGIGKVLIGINKYDIPYCSETNPENEEQIRQYVVEEIKKACRECDDNILSEILKETTPIPLSAEMALLSQLPMGRIMADDTLKFAWNRHCQNFGISTQADLHHWSRITELTKAVTEMVLREKDAILFSKPVNAVIAAGAEKEATTEKEIHLTQSEIEILQMPDDELEERESNLNKAHRKLDRKISSLGEDIESEMRNIIRKGRNTLEDDVDGACNRMRSIVENEFRPLTKFDTKIAPKLDAELTKLSTRTLKRSVDTLASNAKRSIDKCISEFFADSEEVLMRYLPDFDSRSFIKKIQSQIDVEITEKDLFSISNEDSEDDYGVMDFIGDFLNGASFGVLGMAGRFLKHGSVKADVLNHINSISAEFDPTPYLDAVLERKANIINTVREAFLANLIEPLQNQLEEIQAHQQDKASRLKEASVKLERLQDEKKQIAHQLGEIESLKVALN